MSLLAFLLFFPADVRSQTADPHAIFEKKCGRCHGHAGRFARETLTIDDGYVVGRRSGKRVKDTLIRHFGKLNDAEADQVEDMFRRQIEADGLYAKKCRFCHDSAKDMVRQTLTISNGDLIGRYSGRSIEDFLVYHGQLTDDERPIIFDMLTWQLVTDGTTED